jgi:hypothetical protein
MAVLSYREVIPRTFSQRFGEPPTAERKFVCTLDTPTPTQEIIATVGVLFGDQHPEYSYLRMLDGNVTETDRHHAEVTLRYELPKDEDFDPNPLARPDVWSFSTGGGTVPFLYYYHGNDNSDVRALVNAAGDFIEGLTVLAPEVQATISANRASFPLAIAAEVTNAINATEYLGGPPYTWQCNGISGQQTTEIVNDVKITYWQITTTLTYRKHGYIEKIPHVGWHFIEANQKRRVWSWNEDGTERQDAAAPQPLTENGGLKFPGAQGNPDQLLRRPYPAIQFSSFFGTPRL